MSHLAALPEFDLAGRVAIVTGGNGGIGRGIALGLARAGADVAIAARNQDKTRAVVAEIEALGRRALGVTCDLTDPDDINAAARKVQQDLGSVAVLVNNAAIATTADPESPENWDALFRTNVRAPFLFSRAVYGALVANGGGKIINIASGAGLIAWEVNPAYGASKAALIHVTRSLATSWAHNNIQVNCIAPGAFRTEMNPMPDEQSEKVWISKTPARRIGRTEEFAGIAVFLASAASDYLTGQVLAFDGGVTIPSLYMQRPVE